ncbi:MAG: response regulator [Proteobacteria bacterium]|nr:response regulator [Pseudomonadota bacterium]
MPHSEINPKARLMVVDGSAAIRGLIASACEETGTTEVVASLSSVEDAMNVLKRQPPNDLKPDMILIDLDILSDSAEKTLGNIQALAGTASIVFSAMVDSEQEDIGSMGHGQVDIILKSLPRKNAELAKKFLKKVLNKAEQSGVPKSAHVTAVKSPETAIKNSGSAPATYAATSKPVEFTLRKMPTLFIPKAIAIASSTGGPKALNTVFSAFKGKSITIPIFVTQHMPEDFTGLLAKQIATISGLNAIEAKDGIEVKAGDVYIAPGNYHMLAAKEGDQIKIRLNQGQPENFCRPAADPMIRSLVDIYGASLLLVVITGMGQDGMKGAEYLVEKGGVVIAQDQATSVVWGMPGAVATHGLCSAVYPIDGIAPAMIKLSAGKIT